MTQTEWLREGIEKGYCTEPYCDSHDGQSSQDEDVLSELFQFSEGDHCMTVVRVKSSELQDQLDHYRSELAHESLD
jgi:hypothetical protein